MHLFARIFEFLGKGILSNFLEAAMSLAPPDGARRPNRAALKSVRR